MIDITSELPITLRQATKLPELLGPDGRPIHISTIIRWAKNGSKGHMLETIKYPGGLRTTREAVSRFISALNGRPATAATPAQRRAAQAAADRELDKARIR